MNVFVFGTLMYDGVLRGLLGRVPECLHATLHGYRRAGIRQADRIAKGPAIEPNAETSVHGQLLLDLTDQETNILDLFETAAGGYHRVSGRVEADGRTLEADFYVADDELRPLLTQEDWSQSVFERDHLQHYVKERVPELMKTWRDAGLVR